jgi:hypothetical protein
MPKFVGQRRRVYTLNLEVTSKVTQGSSPRNTGATHNVNLPPALTVSGVSFPERSVSFPKFPTTSTAL